jgi:uncharacterized Zn finger protein (UPF0148 family)
MDTEVCKDCGAPLTYAGRGRRPTRCSVHAKAAIRATTVAWDKAHPERRAEMERRSKRKNRATAAATERRWRENNPERYRERIWKQQGITLTWDEFIAMLDAQLWRCANSGCGAALETNAHVDHCHATGDIRGVLCADCNRALGILRDSASRCAGLVEYLVARS